MTTQEYPLGYRWRHLPHEWAAGSRRGSCCGHHGDMTEITRAQAEADLREVAERYAAAQEALTAAERDAEQAVFHAKRAGLSQHDIATIMGDAWNREHNPQFPPVLDLQAPREDSAT